MKIESFNEKDFQAFSSNRRKISIYFEDLSASGGLPRKPGEIKYLAFLRWPLFLQVDSYTKY
jgi:hypothetical protein